MIRHYALFALLAGAVIPAHAADWPQYRGPSRQGTAPAAADLLAEWPAGGPGELWRRPLGIGYSAVTAVGDRVFTMATSDGEEVVLALDAATGAEVWRTAIGPSGVSDMDDSGPRATPTVVDGRLFTASSAGLLVALAATDGALIWEQDLMEGGKPPRFGYSVSPLVDSGQVVVEGGASEEDAGVYAFDAATGALRWQALSGPAGYSSPIAIELGGELQYVFFRRAGAEVVALSPAGAVLWRHPTAALAIITTPIFLPPDRFFVASADDIFGGLMLRVVAADGAYRVEEAWVERLMRNHFNTSVVVGEQIYGFDNGTLRCLDTATGAKRWAKRGLGKGSLIAAGERLYVLGDDGTLVLAEATPEGFVERGRVQAMTGRAWTAPSYAAGRVYLRDFDEVVAFDLRAPALAAEVAPAVAPETQP
jgi:outer membrane protein assembly factor BamB